MAGADPMRKALFAALDYGAVVFGTITAPALRFVGTRRRKLPRFQRLSDRLGFQIRSDHYYEPTYRECDLPADTAKPRQIVGLDFNEAAQLALLAEFTFADELRRISTSKSDPAAFGYHNDAYSYGDAELLYSMIRLKKPRRIIEIGSGQSTLMARLAIEANGKEDSSYNCDHICIEPYEAPWLEKAGPTIIRKRVEDVDLSLFDKLGENDILFIDSSHVIRPWGDVLREFHDIVPRIRKGVVVHVHDIFTPRDYPESWLRIHRRLFNEQYLLESFLAFNASYTVLCAANWLKHDHWEALARACPMLAQNPSAEPGAFWFQRI
jgi:predicted O-methyltransferase YrrM